MSQRALQRERARVRALERLLEDKTRALYLSNKELREALDSLVARELELHHAHKLEAVGQLASGVAHEMNTPLQYVGDSLRFMAEALTDYRAMTGSLSAAVEAHAPPDVRARLAAEAEDLDLPFLDEQVPGAVARSEEGLTRVNRIVRALRQLAHPGQGHAPADLDALVEDALIVARSSLRDVAEVRVELGDLPRVDCAAGELGQVLLNLLVNAAHAMEGCTGPGRLTVRTYVEGEHAVVAIGDTGGGIPPEIRARIMEPFFTTKEVGRGTGQGLAMAFNIVHERHGGVLDFETEVGRGTTFYVRLPVSRALARAS